MVRAALVGLGFIWAATASAQFSADPNGLYSGNDLLRDCTLKSDGFEFCFGKLTGLLSGLEYGKMGKPGIVCRPSNITNGQIVDVVTNELSKHPERRHLPADLIAVHALAAAWPCLDGWRSEWNPAYGVYTFRSPPVKK
jgi:hypothetical protein